MICPTFSDFSRRSGLTDGEFISVAQTEVEIIEYEVDEELIQLSEEVVQKPSF